MLFLSLATPVSAASVDSSSPASLILPFTIVEGNIAYWRIGPFTRDIVAKIRPTMQQIAKAKPRGLILDFRNNEGGEFDVVHELLQTLLPKGVPYIRFFGVSSRGLKVTAQTPLLKASTPVVVLRNSGTGNEADIAIYILAKLRKAGVQEFSRQRTALVRSFKQNSRMDQYRPIKEGVFFVTPDVRVIGNEGGSEGDMIPRAASFIRELSPWNDPKKAAK